MDSLVELSDMSDDGVMLSENQEPVNETTINVGGKRVTTHNDLIEKMGLDKIIVNGFVDRDPDYFEQIFDVIKTIGFDDEMILNAIDGVNDQIIYEMKCYGLLSSVNPVIKIVLKRKAVKFYDDRMVTITVRGQKFHSLNSTMSKSHILAELGDIDEDPRIFRHVLNAMRHGLLCLYNEKITDMLTKYQIDYELIRPLKQEPFDVFSHLVPVVTSDIPEPVNVITTQSKMELGNELIFDLPTVYKSMMKAIICVDLPFIKPTTNEYVDNIESIIIESISLITKKPKKTHFLLHNIDTMNVISNLFHEKENQPQKKQKLLYKDQLIDIVRLIIPIQCINDLPMQSLQLVIKTSKNILKHQTSIPLLNLCIIGLFSSSLKTQPVSLTRHELVTVDVPQDKYVNYNSVIVPLQGLIKELIINVEDNGLIEMDLMKGNTVIEKADRYIMASFLPKKYIGKTMPDNWFYYSGGTFNANGIYAKLIVRKTVSTVKIVKVICVTL